MEFRADNPCPVLLQVGVEIANEVAEADTAEFARFMNTNVTGTLLVTKEVSAAMKLQDAQQAGPSPAGGVRRGSIVNMGSAQSFASMPGMVQYTTAKFAVLGLSKNAGKQCMLARPP